MNRIVGNVIIVDSAMGNNLMLTSASTIINLSEIRATAFTFWSTDTTGICVFTGIDTTNQLIRLTNPNNNPTTIGVVLNGIPFNQLKIPTLTSGTAWVYFK